MEETGSGKLVTDFFNCAELEHSIQCAEEKSENGKTRMKINFDFFSDKELRRNMNIRKDEDAIIRRESYKSYKYNQRKFRLANSETFYFEKEFSKWISFEKESPVSNINDEITGGADDWKSDIGVIAGATAKPTLENVSFKPNLKELFWHLCAKEGVSVTASEVTNRINKKQVLSVYRYWDSQRSEDLKTLKDMAQQTRKTIDDAQKALAEVKHQIRQVPAFFVEMDNSRMDVESLVLENEALKKFIPNFQDSLMTFEIIMTFLMQNASAFVKMNADTNRKIMAFLKQPIESMFVSADEFWKPKFYTKF